VDTGAQRLGGGRPAPDAACLRWRRRTCQARGNAVGHENKPILRPENPEICPTETVGHISGFSGVAVISAFSTAPGRCPGLVCYGPFGPPWRDEL